MPQVKHPELAEGEVFLMNTDELGFSKISWKTKRKGQVAYDAGGNLLNKSPNLFPVFVEIAEIKKYNPRGIIIKRIIFNNLTA